MTHPVLAALEREVARAHALFETLTGDDWARPTRCDPLTVLEVAAHALRGGQRIEEMLEAGPVDSEPEKDGATYFQYDPITTSAEVVKRAQEAAVGRTGPELASAWQADWTRALGRAREALGRHDPVLPGIFGLIRLSEYLRTRVVEVTVHHMDVTHALGRAPNPDADAVTATADVLRTLLGTDLRDHGMDDVRFTLVGTGRAPLDDDERAFLGPLAGRFPLLS